MKLSIKLSAPLVAAAFFGSALSTSLVVPPANADTFSFNTGIVTNAMASASRPETAGKFEIESADDFVTTGTQTSITSATFTGLLTGGATTANVGDVTVEIYRVFPKDLDVARTSGPPTFSTPQVPTRVNSPSDVAFLDRSTTSGDLNFTTSLLSPTFTALNSVQPGGIHPTPLSNHWRQRINHRARGTIHGKLHDTYQPSARSLLLRAASGGDYRRGEFLWLSGTRPNPLFPAGFTDLQSWTRDRCLIPIGFALEQTSSEELHSQHSMRLFRSTGLRHHFPALCRSLLPASAC